jgi:putative membrane protein insertion efficiency factor
MVIVGLLHAYRAIVSPWYGQVCRFYPSCSEYALIAVGRHGALKGTWLATRRLLRCHPWNPGGVDLVPPVRGSNSDAAPPLTCDHTPQPGAVVSNSAPSDRRVA